MKKILSAVLVAVLLVGCVFALASCGKVQGEKPELDLKAAAKALEKEDYTVTHTKDKDALDPWIEERLSAYDKDYENSLTIIVFKDSKTAKFYYEERLAYLNYQKDALKTEIEYSEYLLKEYESKLDSDEIDDLEDEIKDMKEELEELKEDYCYGIDGCTVWYGTADAVKDSK